MRRRLFAGLLVLAGCAAPPPPPPVDPPELPLEIPERWTAAETPVGAPPGEWWESFRDPRLKSLIAQALDENFSVQAAAARIQGALAQARIAGADLTPLVGGNLGARRQRQVFVGLEIPGFSGPLTSLSNTYSASLDVTWEIDLWGRIRSRRSAALAGAQAEAADYVGARLSLVAQTAQTYFAAVEAKRQLELARSTAASNRTTAERIRERYRRGLRPALDLKLTEANLASSEATLHLREEQVEAVIRQLQILLGEYPTGRLELADALPAVPRPVPAGLPSDLLTRRPDLLAAERRYAASVKRVDEAKAERFPRLSLTGSGGSTSEDLSDLVDRDFRVWSLGANLFRPLFEGGRIEAGVDLAESGVDVAFAVYADSVLRAFSEVESSLVAEQILAKREAALGRAVDESRAATELSQRRYTGGLIDIVTLLDAQRRLFVAESQLLTVRRARLDARVGLHLALGGGFEGKTIEEPSK